MPDDGLRWFAYRHSLGSWAPVRSRVRPGTGAESKYALYVNVKELDTSELRAMSLDELVARFPPPKAPVGVVNAKMFAT